MAKKTTTPAHVWVVHPDAPPSLAVYVPVDEAEELKSEHGFLDAEPVTLELPERQLERLNATPED